ncbi:MAG TPA: cytochrome c oxidase assembly protein [Acidimicrobiia bacterium]|nr:cytochrome c oxidase assembly protein [Acidimicrobiia bacterium]
MISWWCTALARPWSWQWIPYPGIWAASILPLVLYWRAVRRHAGAVDRRKALQFVAGVVVFWIASDWPLGTLGAGYLASAHMTQFLLYTLVSAPLLLLGTPEWMARRLTRRLRIERLTSWFGRSLVPTALIYNAILLATHAPGTVEILRNSQWGSFAMDVVWMVAGVLLWLPVISPLSDARASYPWSKMAYLFVTTSVVAVIPASFLTFTSTPIYGIYELAPRIGSITALEDQQLAGIIMKIATIPVIWSTIAVLWFRWTASEAQIA